MKKIISVLLTVIIIAGVFAGCSGGANKADDGKLSIVCTVFPEYDWVMNILGEKAQEADVTLLLDNGADLHNFQPTAEDIIKVSTCDLFIYVGGASDKWVEDALANATNENMIKLNLIEILGINAKKEQVVEGMQGEEEENHAAGEEGPEYDEHVWLSLFNTKLFCTKITEAIAKLDAENSQVYYDNAGVYVDKLNELDNEYKAVMANAKTTTLLFGDRFPFRYLTDDYGLRYYAAFVGCSAETEASFETVKFLAEKVDELGLKYVLIIDKSDGKLANTIIENTKTKDQQVMTLNSMQSITAQDIENGTSYYDIMAENLEVLKQVTA